VDIVKWEEGKKKKKKKAKNRLKKIESALTCFCSSYLEICLEL